MKKQSGKKLVEILAAELKEWPKEVVAYFQWASGEVFATSKGIPTGFGSGLWYVVDSSVKMAYGCPLYDTELELAVDHDTAIVTRSQWEVERAKLSKPKADGQGWIRHKSKTMPVSAGREVEIRTRGGEFEVCRAGGFNWAAEGEDQIMAYRLHQPEQPAEPVEVEAGGPGVTAPNDGPLQWRDRVNEIDRTVEALEEERASLIQKLAGEGVKLIKREAVELPDMPDMPDMSDWRNWRKGDIVRCVSHTREWSEKAKIGEEYVLKENTYPEVVSGLQIYAAGYYMSPVDFKFVSRPTK